MSTHTGGHGERGHRRGRRRRGAPAVHAAVHQAEGESTLCQAEDEPTVGRSDEGALALNARHAPGLRAATRALAVAGLMIATALATAVTGAATPAAGAATGTARHLGDWRIASAGHLSPTAQLGSVTSAGPGRAWAAGQQALPGGVPSGVIMRWNGRTWRRDPGVGLPDVNYWHSVSAASAHDVWAYGRNWSEETMAHYDGRRWRTVSLPALPGGAIHGFSEVAAVPGRVWLAGEQWINTYAHGTWRTDDAGHGVDIVDIDARSARDAWAVGGFALVGQQSRPVVRHWDGSRWHDVALPWSDVRLANVYVESAKSVWASGYTVPTGDGGNQPRIVHWDGKGWHDVTGPVSAISSGGITGDGRGGVWFSGDPDGWLGPPVFWHYDGRNWARVDGARLPAGETQSYTVDDLAPIGRTGRVWAVGGYELIVGEHSAEGRELIEYSTR